MESINVKGSVTLTNQSVYMLWKHKILFSLCVSLYLAPSSSIFDNIIVLILPNSISIEQCAKVCIACLLFLPEQNWMAYKWLYETLRLTNLCAKFSELFCCFCLGFWIIRVCLRRRVQRRLQIYSLSSSSNANPMLEQLWWEFMSCVCMIPYTVSHI